MPAIHPARMKIQVAQLVEKVHQPEAYVRSLHNLLDYYADRTYRPGQSGEPPPLLATYKTPLPVLRQVIRETLPITASDPPAALALVDALWVEPTIEFRLLAISLIGNIQPDPPEPVLNRLLAWIGSSPEHRILEATLDQGFIRFRKEHPKIFYQMVEDWLKADEIYYQRVSLHAMISLISDPAFGNLPAVSRLLVPLIRESPDELRHDLVDVLRNLAHRFPQEASYILQQNLTEENSNVIWITRQVLKDLPAEFQKSLRETLRPYNLV